MDAEWQPIPISNYRRSMDLSPVKNACDWVRDHLSASLGGTPLPMLFYVFRAGYGSIVLCALHPDVADGMPHRMPQEPVHYSYNGRRIASCGVRMAA